MANTTEPWRAEHTATVRSCAEQYPNRSAGINAGNRRRPGRSSQTVAAQVHSVEYAAPLIRYRSTGGTVERQCHLVAA